MYEFKKYKAEEHYNVWNQFVDKSKNGTFLFNRNYMDYHSDRFEDNSILVYRKGKLYAILPANKVGDTLYSHQGLTYGGLIMDIKSDAIGILEVFKYLNAYLYKEGIRKVVYKPVPYIFHKVPAQEDLYALFRYTNAHIIARNISSTIYQNNKIKFIESRKSGLRKAVANNLTVKETADLETFYEILGKNLP